MAGHADTRRPLPNHRVQLLLIPQLHKHEIEHGQIHHTDQQNVELRRWTPHQGQIRQLLLF